MTLSPLTTDDLDTLRWLCMTGLADQTMDAMVMGFCERVLAAGVPLVRLHVSMDVVHPQMRALGVTWVRGRGLNDIEGFAHAREPSPEWVRSPGAWMLEHNVLAHAADLSSNTPPEPYFELYNDLKALGATEYRAQLYPFGWTSTANQALEVGELGAMISCSSDAAGGFGATWARLEALCTILALAVKTRAFRDMAETLMVTYLGPDAGRRVLHGDVHRGAAHSIPAAILLADLRGFTALADSFPTSELMPLLDSYMEAICAPVEAHGGQVLKFLGDGVLAVFDGPAAAALEAARDARAAVAAINAERAAAGRPWMPLDVALHRGDVVYGNVGAANRMEFTVIGPAVNEAARMEAKCGELGVDILISDDFVAALDDRHGIRTLGEHSLKGVTRRRTLFTLEEAR